MRDKAVEQEMYVRLTRHKASMALSSQSRINGGPPCGAWINISVRGIASSGVSAVARNGSLDGRPKAVIVQGCSAEPAKQISRWVLLLT